jgi:hypothetical protein
VASAFRKHFRNRLCEVQLASVLLASLLLAVASSLRCLANPCTSSSHVCVHTARAPPHRAFLWCYNCSSRQRRRLASPRSAIPTAMLTNKKNKQIACSHISSLLNLQDCNLKLDRPCHNDGWASAPKTALSGHGHPQCGGTLAHASEAVVATDGWTPSILNEANVLPEAVRSVGAATSVLSALDHDAIDDHDDGDGGDDDMYSSGTADSSSKMITTAESGCISDSTEDGGDSLWNARRAATALVLQKGRPTNCSGVPLTVLTGVARSAAAGALLDLAVLLFVIGMREWLMYCKGYAQVGAAVWQQWLSKRGSGGRSSMVQEHTLPTHSLRCVRAAAN